MSPYRGMKVNKVTKRLDSDTYRVKSLSIFFFEIVYICKLTKNFSDL